MKRSLAAAFTGFWRRPFLSMHLSRVIVAVIAIFLTAPVLAAQKVELSVDTAKVVQRSTATFSASSPSISATVFTRAFGLVQTPQSRILAASVATSLLRLKLSSPLDTFDYYKDMSVANGGFEAVSKWSQFYFAPGMAHCGGGPGLDQFDLLGAMVNWVEKGTAPTSVIVTGKAFQNEVDRSALIRSTPTTRDRAIRKTRTTSNAVEAPPQSRKRVRFSPRRAQIEYSSGPRSRNRYTRSLPTLRRTSVLVTESSEQIGQLTN